MLLQSDTVALVAAAMGGRAAAVSLLLKRWVGISGSMQTLIAKYGNEKIIEPVNLNATDDGKDNEEFVSIYLILLKIQFALY
jgi:hypothetical protein